MSDDDDAKAEELLDEVDIRSVSIIWGEHDDRPEVAWSGCSVYEAIGLTVVGFFRLLGVETLNPDDHDDDLEDE